MQTVGILVVTGAAVVNIGLILQIVGLATPGWSVASSRGVSLSVGLWKICTMGSQFSCVDYSDFKMAKSDVLIASEAFAIIGMVFGIFSSALILFQVIKNIMGQVVPPGIAGEAVTTGCFAFAAVLINVVTWAAKIHKDLKIHQPILLYLDYSFDLSIVGGSLYLIGAFIFFVGSK